ncbi:hypothetical protein GQ600_2427 [Phytophthora cactorum]|nr:hypothetical protein GQ600_2427 [Phytophthora cactorum]
MARAALGTALELRLRTRAELIIACRIHSSSDCLHYDSREFDADAVDHLPARKTMGGTMLTKSAADVDRENRHDVEP